MYGLAIVSQSLLRESFRMTPTTLARLRVRVCHEPMMPLLAELENLFGFVL
jgi:hypothetical protein